MLSLLSCSLTRFCWFNLARNQKVEHTPTTRALTNVWKVNGLCVIGLLSLINFRFWCCLYVVAWNYPHCKFYKLKKNRTRWRLCNNHCKLCKWFILRLFSWRIPMSTRIHELLNGSVDFDQKVSWLITAHRTKFLFL